MSADAKQSAICEPPPNGSAVVEILPSSHPKRRMNEESPLLTSNGGRRKPATGRWNSMSLAGLTMMLVLLIGGFCWWFFSFLPRMHQQQVVVVDTTRTEDVSAEDGTTSTEQPVYRDVCRYYTTKKQQRPRILETSMHHASQPWTWKECLWNEDTIVEVNAAHAPDAILDTDFGAAPNNSPTILGFGGAFTEASAMNWQRLSPKGQDAVVQLLFNATIGLGYTLGRIPIHSCDFSIASYTFDDVEDDFTLEYFDRTVQHDVDNGMIPFLQAAQRVDDTLRILRFPRPSLGQFTRGGHFSP